MDERKKIESAHSEGDSVLWKEGPTLLDLARFGKIGKSGRTVKDILNIVRLMWDVRYPSFFPPLIPMSSALDPIQAAAMPVGLLMSEEAAHGATSAKKLMALVSDTEQFLREIKVPAVNHLSFEACGLPFKATHTPEPHGARLVIWGMLGYLPFSVVSHKKRQELISILEATHRLPHIKFGVDAHMQILVTGSYKIANPLTPDYLFVPLIHFLEEALPFIRLIGQAL